VRAVTVSVSGRRVGWGGAGRAGALRQQFGPRRACMCMCMWPCRPSAHVSVVPHRAGSTVPVQTGCSTAPAAPAAPALTGGARRLRRALRELLLLPTAYFLTRPIFSRGSHSSYFLLFLLGRGVLYLSSSFIWRLAARHERPPRPGTTDCGCSGSAHGVLSNGRSTSSTKAISA